MANKARLVSHGSAMMKLFNAQGAETMANEFVMNLLIPEKALQEFRVRPLGENSYLSLAAETDPLSSYRILCGDCFEAETTDQGHYSLVRLLPSEVNHYQADLDLHLLDLNSMTKAQKDEIINTAALNDFVRSCKGAWEIAEFTQCFTLFLHVPMAHREAMFEALPVLCPALGPDQLREIFSGSNKEQISDAYVRQSKNDPSPFYALMAHASDFLLRFPADEHGVGPYWLESGEMDERRHTDDSEEEVECVPLGGNRYRLACQECGPFSALRLHWGDEFFAETENGFDLVLTRIAMPMKFVHHRFIASGKFTNENPIATILHACGGGWETVAEGMLTLTIPVNAEEEFLRQMQANDLCPGVIGLCD